jgi:hypothetical protein
MTGIDWSKAPEGATHWEPKGQHAESWMRLDGDVWFFRSVDTDRWCQSFVENPRISRMMLRPQPSAWNGTGLPPAGTVCEVNVKGELWARAEIKYQGKNITVWLWESESTTQAEFAKDPISLGFRPIRTPEQIAADEREAAITEFCELIGRNGTDFVRVTLARIYDAGYRKP